MESHRLSPLVIFTIPLSPSEVSHLLTEEDILCNNSIK